MTKLCNGYVFEENDRRPYETAVKENIDAVARRKHRMMVPTSGRTVEHGFMHPSAPFDSYASSTFRIMLGFKRS